MYYPGPLTWESENKCKKERKLSIFQVADLEGHTQGDLWPAHWHSKGQDGRLWILGFFSVCSVAPCMRTWGSVGRWLWWEEGSPRGNPASLPFPACTAPTSCQSICFYSCEKKWEIKHMVLQLYIISISVVLLECIFLPHCKPPYYQDPSPHNLLTPF